jgi:hypothetical protein
MNLANYTRDGIIDITYANLATAIGASTLTPGGLYRITDFATTHYIVDGAGTRYYEKIAQVDTITLTVGTAGTASITGAGALTKTITFNTTLAQTATDFVHEGTTAADYAAVGITIDHLDVDITFTAIEAGTAFTTPAIGSPSDDLAGTVANTTLNDDPIIIGATEPLIVTALAADKIHSVVRSETYPQDIIHYDWNPDNWMDDPSFADVESEPATSIIDDFKGVITFRHDTLLDNYVGCDFRNCKSRRWKINVAAWTADPYVVGAYATSGTNIYRCRADTTNNEPPNATYWVSQIDLSISEYWNVEPTGKTGLPSGQEFIDLRLFVEGSGDATYDLQCMHNHFYKTIDDYTWWFGFGTSMPNNVIYLNGSQPITSNIVGAYFQYNSIAPGFSENEIGAYFSTNILGVNFLTNHLSDTFEGNVIGESFAGNLSGSGFQNNKVGTDCANNNFHGQAQCSIGSSFVRNVFMPVMTSVDFSAATHVYADYNCTLFTDIDGNAKLSYAHDDAFVIVNANA